MLNRPLEIVILAAGKGTRMRSSTPKVLHEVAGKSLLAHVLDTARALNPDRIHVVIGYGGDEVRQRLASDDIHWIEQAQQLGTGHAVQQAIPSVANGAELLVMYGDVPLIRPQTLQRLVDAMPQFPLALLTAELDDPAGYGRILRDDTDSVHGIVEQKDATPQQQAIREINTGFLCARAEHLGDWLSALNNDNAQQEYYLTDITGLAHQSGHSIATAQPEDIDEITGINSRIELAQVECAMQHRIANRLMEDGVTIIDPYRVDIRGEVNIGNDTVIDINAVITGPTTIGSNVKIGPNCVITASEIADHVTIHPNTVVESAKIGEHVNVGPFARLRPGTELAPEVRIGNFVETKNAKLAKGAKANHLSYVGDATVGEATNIGAGVITCNYDGANKHQTKIGNDVFVGSDSQLVAPVEIGDGATIGAGSTITQAVPADNLAVSRGRQRQIEGWQRPRKKKPKERKPPQKKLKESK